MQNTGMNNYDTFDFAMVHHKTIIHDLQYTHDYEF